VGSFGERLRREREMRGISLDEIATATKISTRNLKALEDEKFSQLPGGIFNKGFVRAYAKFLGIDEEQMVAEYSTASQEVETAREQKFRNDFSKVEFSRADDEEQREISLEPKSQWGTIALIVLIAVAVFGGWEYYQKKKLARQQEQAQVPPAVMPAPASSITMPPAGTTAVDNTAAAATTNTLAQPGITMPPIQGAADKKLAETKPADLTEAEKQITAPPLKEADVPATSNGPIDVKIHANQDSWISITADGKTIMKGTLPAASEKAVRAKEQVVVVLGNVGGVEVSYNGKPIDNLGTGKEVKKITFTPSGYE
jgi:cytoskeleton protein RodZ